MAKTTAVYSPKNVKNVAVSFVSGDGTSVKEIFAAGADDSLVRSLGVISQESGAKLFNIYLNNGSADFLIGVISVPANAGSNGTTPAFDVLDATEFLSLDTQDKKFLPLKTGWKLRAAAQSTVSTTVTFIAGGEDF